MQNLHSTGSPLDASDLSHSQHVSSNGCGTQDEHDVEFQLLDIIRSGHLARRFGLEPSIAAILASLAWGAGR
jgi:hypothetical protein